MKKPFTILLMVCLLALVAISFSAGGVSADSHLDINEVRIDQPDDDNDEYFELYGPASASLNDYTYIVLGDSTAGGSGVVENVTPLTGQSIPSSGYFVAAESTFTLGTADLVTTLNFENSDNVTHMLVAGFTGALGDDLDTNDDGVLDVTPWTSVESKIALIKEDNPPTTTEWHYGPPTVGPDGSYVPGYVFYCMEGINWRIGPYDPDGGKDSPGAENVCVEIPDPGSCGDPATLIHAVQGNGDSSPLVGEIVTVEAVVHGDFQGSTELEAFFLQEEDEDADDDPKTSEGLYVEDNLLETDEGDVVRVQGVVEENYDRTQLTDISSAVVCSSEKTVTPADITLPVESMDTWEQSEGMSIKFEQTLYATDNYSQGRYGEVGLAVAGRLFNPTNIVPPGVPANDMQDANDLRRILLDDGSSKSNPDPVPYIAADGTLRAGDTVVMLQGALDYGYSNYRLHPTEDVSFTRVNDRPEAPDVGGSLTVANFNVLNYFTTIDTGDPICGPSGDLDCRGADSPEEFVRQRTKIIDAISRMDADVVGLTEIENNAKAAVEDLVAGLNDKMGAGTYMYIDTGTIGADAIKVAYIYKPATVKLVGDYKILDSTVDPAFNDDKNRPALAQTFEEVASGEKFTAAINHLKSKGSDCDALGDPDTGDGQGNCNKTRTSAAKAEADWLATDPTESGDPDILIIGDLNAYAMEDPISTLQAKGYMNLVARYGGMYAYSYVFFGQAGYLDHSLANKPMLPQVTGTTVWHINADEPSALNYNNYNHPDLYQPDAYRSSDHDPVIVGLNLGQYPVYMPVIMTPAPPTDPFTLVAPADGAKLDTLIPTFKFAPADNLPANAGGCLVLEKVPDQTNCKMSWGTQYEDWEFVYWNNLEPDTTYYWRIGAVYDYDYENKDWGEQQWSFTTGPASGPIPSVPVLVAPADGATVSTDTVTLQWQAVDGAAEYKFKVRDVTNDRGWLDFGIYPPDTQVGQDRLAHIFNIFEGPEFKWTVAARNDYAWGAYAPYWYFTAEE